MQLESLLKKLNLSDKGELYKGGEYPDSLSNRIKESLQKIKPDASFYIKNEPLLLFFENSKNSETLEKQIWNFNQSPAIFIQEKGQWIVKNGFKFLENKKGLQTLSDTISDFEYFKIITGQTWQAYQKHFENKNRVDYFLLKNIETARNILIEKGGLPDRIANALIGRVIFIRYLIDRNVELNKYKILKNTDFHTLLSNTQKAYSFFKQIREDFNGNLFPLEHSIDGKLIQEKDIVIDTDLKTIISLLKGDKLSESGTQTSLFDIYDFSIIPIEFISNVYEKFIGVENQREKGAYYTPLFLVDYIQKETVGEYFKNNSEEYNCKVLDPACGSGIFLVETLRHIIAQYQKNNKDYKEKPNAYKEDLKKLLIDNIFGVDKDEDAISVAVFSLYITLLDHLNPRSIVGFKFPELIGTNFFCADFFDLDKPFDDKLKKHVFQYILGNPPWGTKHPKDKQPFEKYIENRKEEEKSTLELESREIAEAFLVRVSDFNFNACAFIIVSKILYKLSRKKGDTGIFRRYFLENFKLNQVLELSSVRHQVFDKSNDKAIAPAAVLFYSKKSKEVKNNIVTHISLKPNLFFNTFKLMVIEKYDIKEISQKILLKNDWFWKVLVYGNILDYYFIKRLKRNKTFYEYLSNKKEFIYGTGINIGGGDKNSIEEHKNIECSVDSNKKGLKPFYIKYSTNFLLKYKYAHRPRNIDLFKSPVLLVGKGVDGSFRAKSAISEKDAVYTDAIIGIKPLTDKGESLIKLFLALFHSELFRYYIMITGSSVGIEREKIHNKDIFSFPVIEPKHLESLTKKIKSITDLAAKHESSNFEDSKKQTLSKEIDSTKKDLNKNIFDIYDVSEQENDLIDYANTITIPLLKGTAEEKRSVLRATDYKSNELERYAQIFISHFGNRFNADHHYFEVEIVWSKHTILMKFKIIPAPSKAKRGILWKKEGDNTLLQNITKLSFENLSRRLYIQKDVKGFEKDFFYIAKPNEYKVWHPALAYLDLSEFIDELHRNKKA